MHFPGYGKRVLWTKKMLTSCVTFPDLERFVIFITASSPFTPATTVMTDVAKWQRLRTVPLGCISAWSRPTIALTAPPNEHTGTQPGCCPFLHLRPQLRQPMYIYLDDSLSPFLSCWRVLQTAGGLWCLKIHERESITKVVGLGWDVCFSNSASSSTMNCWTVRAGFLVQPSGSLQALWKCSLKGKIFIFHDQENVGQIGHKNIFFSLY